MRCYLITAGTLLSVAVALAQQTGSNLSPPDGVSPNVVPQGVLNGAVYRALLPPTIPPAPKTGPPAVFRVQPKNIILNSKVCSIPLLEARTKPTNDRIARSTKKPGGQPIDPKIVLPPPAPPCPKR